MIFKNHYVMRFEIHYTVLFKTDSDASDFINSMKKLTEKKSMKPEDISRIYQIISSSKISSE